MSKKRRAVIVAGRRTPFIRAFEDFIKYDTINLGSMAVDGLLKKTELDRSELDALYWSGVVLPNITPNIGREITLNLKLPSTVESYTVSRACSSSLLSITLAAAAIERGEADVIIAGGSDSTSNAEVPLPRKIIQTLGPLVMGKRKGMLPWLQAVSQLMPITDIIPTMPRVAERSTGQLMGEAAEEMARRNSISREAQDEFALASHRNAARAAATGRFDREMVSVKNGSGMLNRDNNIRPSSSFERLARLRPVFSRNGTITAGNASPLTDGAAAVLLMDEEKARALGYTPLAAFRSWHYSAVDPFDQLLIGPAVSMPRALHLAGGMQLKDIDLVDIHEAFAGQVLSVLKMLENKKFNELHQNNGYIPATVDPARLNIHGGSISIGHPFAATGARMVTTMANELHSGNKETALLGICAAGGLGAAAVLEAV